MTVTYSLDVSSSSFFCLYKLLFRWKGSIWKSIWAELLIWLIAYAFISAIYRNFLWHYEGPKANFERLCEFFYVYSEYIPITFMLGFYVSTVYTRWWEIFMNIGWIDSPMLLISCVVRGADDNARIVRRNIIRYLVLTQAMVFRDVSAAVHRRFPTMQHLVTAGLMTEKELKIFDEIHSPHAKYWQPMHWVFSLVRHAREQGYISSDIVMCDLLEKLRQYRVNVLNLTLYDWVPVPLVYTQVVHIAVRGYFIIALLGRQYLDEKIELKKMPQTLDIYVPVMTILQFICFTGWMKVAEVLLNPLGEDDDDFECNWILDRNLQIAFSVVDDAYGKFPPPEKDPWWDEMHPEPLYTAESAARMVNPQIGSCADMAAEDDHFMLRPHRQGVNGRHQSMAWDRIEEDDIVPVKEIDRDRPDFISSMESLNFSASTGNKSSRMNAMLRKINQQKQDRNRADSVASSHATNQREQSVRRRKRSSMSMFASDATMDASRRSSIASSVNIFDHSSYSPTTPQPIYTPFMDSLKIGRSDEEKSNASAWCVDEMLPVIEEEDEKKRRLTEEDGSQRTLSSDQSLILNAENLKKARETREGETEEGRMTARCDSGVSTEDPDVSIKVEGFASDNHLKPPNGTLKKDSDGESDC